MTLSRRNFLTGLAAGTLLAPHTFAFPHVSASAAYDEPPGDRVKNRLGDYPLAVHVARFREQQRNAARAFRRTGLDRREYLRLTDGIVRFFATYQDARGVSLLFAETRNVHG